MPIGASLSNLMTSWQGGPIKVGSSFYTFVPNGSTVTDLSCYKTATATTPSSGDEQDASNRPDGDQDPNITAVALHALYTKVSGTTIHFGLWARTSDGTNKGTLYYGAFDTSSDTWANSGTLTVLKSNVTVTHATTGTWGLISQIGIPGGIHVDSGSGDIIIHTLTSQTDNNCQAGLFQYDSSATTWSEVTSGAGTSNTDNGALLSNSNSDNTVDLLYTEGGTDNARKRVWTPGNPPSTSSQSSSTTGGTQNLYTFCNPLRQWDNADSNLGVACVTDFNDASTLGMKSGFGGYPYSSIVWAATAEHAAASPYLPRTGAMCGCYDQTANDVYLFYQSDGSNTGVRVGAYDGSSWTHAEIDASTTKAPKDAWWDSDHCNVLVDTGSGFEVIQYPESAGEYTATIAATLPNAEASLSASHTVPAFTATVAATLPNVEASLDASHTVPAFTSTVAAALPNLAASLTATATGGGPALPVDQLTSTHFAFSLYKIRDGYSGNCLKVRRASDNETQNIGFTTVGDFQFLDVSALETFCAGTDGFIDTLYDQSTHADHITQATTANQWKIVANGSVVTNEYGEPSWLQDKQWDFPLPASTTTDNICLFFVGNRKRNPTDSTARRIIALKGSSSVTSNRFLFSWVSNTALGYGSMRASGGDGTSSYQVNPTIRAALTNRPNVLSFTTYPIGSSTRARVYRNNLLLGQNTTFSAGGATVTSVESGASGIEAYGSTIILAASQSDGNREACYNALNDIYGYGMRTDYPVNGSALLPQTYKWMVDLYDWMETIDTGDVAITPAALSWDNTYDDVDQLYHIRRVAYGERSHWAQFASHTSVVRALDKWFVLDDGAGAGIEGSGVIRMFRTEPSAEVLPLGTALALYDLDLPKAGATQGNPYYQHSGLAHRMLMYACANLIMLVETLDTAYDVWILHYAFGGSSAQLLQVIHRFWSLLSTEAQDAVKECCRSLIYHSRDVGPWTQESQLGNLTSKGLAALATCRTILSGESFVVAKADGAIRQVMFGGYDETLSDVLADYAKDLHGVIQPGQFPQENGGGADTTYTGHALNSLLRAYSELEASTIRDEILETINLISEWMTHQWFTDGDDEVLTGPSGYASRTGGDLTTGGDGLDPTRKGYQVAVGDDRTHPLLPTLPAEATMVTEVTSGINWWNGTGDVDTSLTTTPDTFIVRWGDAWWPLEMPYNWPADFYSTHKAVIDAASSTIDPPFVRTADINKNFGREFWIYKDNDGSQDFGWMIDSSVKPGIVQGTGSGHAGWNNGSVQAFWTESTGPVICSRHNKSGDQTPNAENTRVWSLLKQWACEQTWGYSADGTYGFGTAATENGTTRTVDYSQVAGSPPRIVYTQRFGAASTSGIDGMQHPEAFPSLNVLITKTWSALSSGLRLQLNITKTAGSDNVYELWQSIPVMLHRNNTGAPANDATIQYKDGSTWTTLTPESSPIATDAIRIGKHGSYAYINFAAEREVVLGPLYIQTYQGTSRHRNLNISLKSSAAQQETNTAWPSSIDLDVTFSTTAAANEYSATIAATLPAATASLTASAPIPDYDAAVAAVLPSVTADVTATAAVPAFSAWIEATLPGVEASATAETIPPYTATIAATLPQVTASITASAPTADYNATIAADLPSVTADLTATAAVPAFAAWVDCDLPALTADLTASHVIPSYTATIAATLPALEAAASAVWTETHDYAATINAVLPSITADLTATKTDTPQAYDATITVVLPAIDANAAAFTGILRTRHKSRRTTRVTGRRRN